MREVIAADGRHYRLKPGRPDIVQVQDKSGAHFRTHMICRASGEHSAEEIAAFVLAMMGHLSPQAKGRMQESPDHDVTNYLDENGNVQWSGDPTP